MALWGLSGCSNWWVDQPDNRTDANIASFAAPYQARQQRREAYVEAETQVDGREETAVTVEQAASGVVTVSEADRARAAALQKQGKRSPQEFDHLTVQRAETRLEGPLAEIAAEEAAREREAQAQQANADDEANDTDNPQTATGDTAKSESGVGLGDRQGPGLDAAAEAGKRVGRMQEEKNPETEYLLDAMVGSVNGVPVYASSILKEIDPQLQALSKTQSVPEFRRQAEQLINARLQQMVTDTLIYGEAERDLSSTELPGLRMMLEDYREELLRNFGEGSLMRAESRLLDERGQTVDQAVQSRREELVVRRYMQRKVTPKIVVTRRDIERFYKENEERFNPPPKRIVRLIVTPTPELAVKVEERLAAGETFEQVASDENLNQYSADEGGLWGEVEGDEPFGNEEVNAALAPLQEGQHSPAVEAGNGYWILFVEKETTEPSISLKEAQVKIEQLLRQQQFRFLSEMERQRLMKQGSYNPLDEMSASLLDIAMSRYIGVAD